MLSSKRRWVGLVVVMLLGARGAGCGRRTSLTINAEQSYSGRTIDLKVGDGVKVTLTENPSTGYKWEFLAKPEPICVIVTDAYVANTAIGTVGSGGVHHWDFRAVDKGTTTVNLVYRRPWEKDATPARTFLLTLVVK
jgi:inhibitor of cysteine peptidase